MRQYETRFLQRFVLIKSRQDLSFRKFSMSIQYFDEYCPLQLQIDLQKNNYKLNNDEMISIKVRKYNSQS